MRDGCADIGKAKIISVTTPSCLGHVLVVVVVVAEDDDAVDADVVPGGGGAGHSPGDAESFQARAARLGDQRCCSHHGPGQSPAGGSASWD